MPSFGNASVTLLAFIVCLSIIVFVHEFGHYYIGKISGIKAEVFSVGFGPVLISRVDKHGTVWQIAAFPFGGYVKFKGDKGAASDPDVDRLNAMDRNDLRDTMHGAPLWARAATVAAGPAFNFIFSALVFVGLFMYQGVTKVPLTIGTVYDFPYASDIRTGDKIVSVDGVPAPEGEDFEQFFNAIRASKSFPLVDYVVERDGSVMSVQGPSMDTARINQLVPRSAAIEAGLAVGDVITQVNGEDIFSFQDLKTRVEGSNGAALNLTVWRKGDVFTTKLVPKRVDEQADDGTFTAYWRIGIVGSLYSFEPMTETVPLGRSISHDRNCTAWSVHLGKPEGHVCDHGRIGHRAISCRVGRCQQLQHFRPDWHCGNLWPNGATGRRGSDLVHRCFVHRRGDGEFISDPCFGWRAFGVLRL